VVRQHYPFLATACHVVANIRIRNMATIGGNLAHADSQSDPPAALVALDASVELSRRDGKRTVKLADFLIGSYETGLARDEILTALMVPPPANSKGTYLKFTTRSSEDRPCAGGRRGCRANGAGGAARVVAGGIPRSSGFVRAISPVKSDGRDDRKFRRAAAAVDPIDDLRGPADYNGKCTGAVRRA
jgi:carbon-monoxide dehydrogenase medium subunit